MSLASKLIAHRGNAQEYPENSLAAIMSALKLGCQAIEVDIQFCTDHIPVLLHDPDLVRTANQPERIYQLPWAQARQVSIGEASRFATQFAGELLPSLAELVKLASRWPGRQFFIEIKEESLAFIPVENAVQIIYQHCLPVLSQCYFICYSSTVLTAMRVYPDTRIGLIITHWDQGNLDTLMTLNPEAVICNWRKLPANLQQLPLASAEWAFYEVTDFATANWLFALGARWIETMQPHQLLLAAEHA